MGLQIHRIQLLRPLYMFFPGTFARMRNSGTSLLVTHDQHSLFYIICCEAPLGQRSSICAERKRETRPFFDILSQGLSMSRGCKVVSRRQPFGGPRQVVCSSYAVVLLYRFAPQLHWATGACASSITSDLSWRKRCSGFADKTSPISSRSVIGSPVRSAKYIRSPMRYHSD